MRIALGVEYDGSQYCGWQRQKHDPETVQEYLEKAHDQRAEHVATESFLIRHLSSLLPRSSKTNTPKRKNPEGLWLFGVPVRSLYFESMG